jgi:GlpG protein
MRMAGLLSDRSQAERLADYLLSLGIEARVSTEEDRFGLWILDDEHLSRVRELLAAFAADPNASMYVQASAKAAEIRRLNAEAETKARRNLVDVRGRWIYGVRGRRPLTWGLIGLSVLVTLVTQMGSNASPMTHWLVMASYELGGGYVRWTGLSEILSGQVWRLVTPVFIHLSPLHLLFNMFWLRDLGSLIEVRKGGWFLAALTVVIAVPSNLVQYFWAGPAFGGMSGVVYGLFGYVWLTGRANPTSGMYLQQNTVTIMLAWLVLCFTGLLGPVANGAHVGGLVVGCAVAYLGQLL